MNDVGTDATRLSLLIQYLEANGDPTVLLERSPEYTVRWRSYGLDLGHSMLQAVNDWARLAPAQRKDIIIPGWNAYLLAGGQSIVLRRIHDEHEEDVALAIQAPPPLPPTKNACTDLQAFAGFEVPGIPRGIQAQFLELFDAVDWASTDLGPMGSWGNDLRQQVRLCLMSPFPVLLIWGEAQTMLYNHGYSKVIGQKHPRILGMTYRAGWPEVWAQIESPVSNAYKGVGAHVEGTLMFLQREEDASGKSLLEETYFSWSMIPLRSNEDEPIGIWIPNTDVSSSVIASRRMQTFATLSRHTSDSSSYMQYWTSVWESLRQEPTDIDLPSIAIYCGTSSEDEAMSDDHDSKSDSSSTWTAAQEARFSQMRRRGVRNPSQEALSVEDMRLVTQRPPNCVLPKSVPVLAGTVPKTMGESSDLLWHAMRKLQKGDPYVLFDESDSRALFRNTNDVWGDPIRSAIVLPIQTATGAHLDAIIVVALNSRLNVDKVYIRFLELLGLQLGAGLAIVKLFAVKLAEAQYRAWVNEQQRKEVRKALDQRTEELLRAEGTFSRVADTLPCGLWIADEDRKIIYTNDAWHRISGYPRDAPIEKYASFVDPEHGERCSKEMATYWDPAGEDEQKDGIFRPQVSGGFMFRWKGETDDGLPRWCSNLTARELELKTGKVLSVVGILTDMSTRKWEEDMQKNRADDALHRKGRLNRFVDLLSHELRNPMAAIQSCVQLISDRIKEIHDQPNQDPETVAALAESLDEFSTINFCLTHMHRLVDETLSLSKIEHDFRMLSIEPFQPELLLRKTIRMYDSELRSKNIETTINVGSGISSRGDVWLLSDSSKVMQILINFLSNSIKFTAQSPTRRITVNIDLTSTRPRLRDLYSSPSQAGSTGQVHLEDRELDSSPARTPEQEGSDDKVFLLISVADTGVGLSVKQQAVLFRRFAQATPKTQVTYGGSGLGLYISRKVAELLGGGCGMESEEGKGSTFSFYVQASITPSPDAPGPEPDFENMARKLAYPLPRQPPPPAGQVYSAGSATKDIMSEVILEKNTAADIASPTPKSKGKAKSAETAEKPHHVVLLVEDNLINQKLLVKQLTRKGCTVYTADHGGHAIEHLVRSHREGNVVDVCLMDVEMPEVDGLTASRRIRALEADNKLSPVRLPILGVTANARPEQIEQMLDAGMDSVLTKPFKIEGLMSQLHGMVALRQRD